MKLLPLIELDHIVKLYKTGDVEETVLKGISLQVNQGEMIAIVGISGSGKSTLMNIIGLLDRPTTGSYYLLGKNMFEVSVKELSVIRNQTIGFVFQSFFLLPRLTVLQNVGLPLTYRELPEQEINERAHVVLQRVGIDHLSQRRPRELSGGQQQRAAIARALVGQPTIILADEPTGALDSKIGQEIMELFIQLNQIDKNTMIIITHDINIARQCQRIVQIQDGSIVTSTISDSMGQRGTA